MVEEDYIVKRLRKLKLLKEKGIEPYPYSFNTNTTSAFILNKYAGIKNEHSKESYSLAGRIMLLRVMGKATFLNILDGEGRIQAYLTKDILKNDYDIVKFLDIGDWIGIKGSVFRTKKGEITIQVSNLTLLCKSLRPLPEKFHGLKNPETRYRKRYLDLIMNPEVKRRFIVRSRFIKALREYLEKEGFIEIETPALQPIYGGARAKPFITYLNALDMKIFLRISDELYLKKLMVGGFLKVFEFGKDFRNEGVDRSHNPEFTQLEWYEAFVDYKAGMKRFENAVAYAVNKVLGTTKITYQGVKIDLKPPWKRINMTDAIKEHAGIDVKDMSKNELEEFMKKNSIEKDVACNSWGMMVEKIFEEMCEDKIVQPTFIINHPAETTPLCKYLREDKRFIERAEPYIAGMEMGNLYSELNDPVLQRRLLEEQAKMREKGDEESNPMDESFVEAVECGMPPAGGVGMGIDRLAMIITDSHSIREIIPFPFLKKENEDGKG